MPNNNSEENLEEIFKPIITKIKKIGIRSLRREQDFYSIINFKIGDDITKWNNDKLKELQKAISSYLFNQILRRENLKININESYLIYSFINLVLTSKIFLVIFQKNMGNAFLKDSSLLLSALRNITSKIINNLKNNKLNISGINNENSSYDLKSIKLKRETEDSYTLVFEFKNLEGNSRGISKGRIDYINQIEDYFNKNSETLFAPFIEGSVESEMSSILENFNSERAIEEDIQNRKKDRSFRLSKGRIVVPIVVKGDKRKSSQNLINEYGDKNDSKNNSQNNNSINQLSGFQLRETIIGMIKKEANKIEYKGSYLEIIKQAFSDTLEIYINGGKPLNVREFAGQLAQYEKILDDFIHQATFFNNFYLNKLRNKKDEIIFIFNKILDNNKNKIKIEFKKIIEKYVEEGIQKNKVLNNLSSKKNNKEKNIFDNYIQLTNLAINEFLKHWKETESGQLIVGDLGEYITTAFLNNIPGSQTAILAKSLNDEKKQLHIDILLKLETWKEISKKQNKENNSLGVQSKYSYNIVSQLANSKDSLRSFSFKIYDDTAPALIEGRENGKYVYGKDARRYFQTDNEFETYAGDLQKQQFYSQGNEWLQVPVNNFSKWLRYEDRIGGEFSEFKNNFYEVNGFYMPASFIFNEVLKELEKKEKSKFFTLTEDKNNKEAAKEDKSKNKKEVIKRSSYFNIIKLDNFNRLQFNGYRLKFSNIIDI